MNEETYFLVDFDKNHHAGIISINDSCSMVFPPFRMNDKEPLDICPKKHALGKATSWEKVQSYFFSIRLLNSAVFYYGWSSSQKAQNPGKKFTPEINYVNQMLTFWKSKNEEELWQRFLCMHTIIGFSQNARLKLRKHLNKNGSEYAKKISVIPKKISASEISDNFKGLVNFIEDFLIKNEKWEDVHAITLVILDEYDELSEKEKEKIKKLYLVSQKFTQFMNKSGIQKEFNNKPTHFV